jgi:hypothetical protein
VWLLLQSFGLCGILASMTISSEDFGRVQEFVSPTKEQLAKRGGVQASLSPEEAAKARLEAIHQGKLKGNLGGCGVHLTANGIVIDDIGTIPSLTSSTKVESTPAPGSVTDEELAFASVAAGRGLKRGPDGFIIIGEVNKASKQRPPEVTRLPIPEDIANVTTIF